MGQELPRILIVSRLVWNDYGSSNTLTDFFQDYDSTRIARIYIETKVPQTKCCQHFFQISEIALLKKIVHWNLKTGRTIDTSNGIPFSDENNSDENRESSIMSFVRGHRSFLFTWLRDLLWLIGGWKSKELNDFITEFNPDVVWVDGSPLILMNRLNNYVIKVANKPAVTFLMDDAYSFKSCRSFSDYIYRFVIRKHIRKTIDISNHVFVASPKMKEEYDRCFGINSTFISKAIDFFEFNSVDAKPHLPLRLLYLGNLLIGRADTLALISNSIERINADKTLIQLSIYSADEPNQNLKKALSTNRDIKVYPSVSYKEVPGIIAENDVQIFAESLSIETMKIARLSFSTKIIDYLGSGKCIFAVGPADIAPIEYFKKEDAAIIASNEEQVFDKLNELMIPGIVEEYARKAYDCGINNHLRSTRNKKLFAILKEVSGYK